MKAKLLESSHYEQWDSFVEQSPQGDVFCYSWWLEAITKSHFNILVIIENDEIVAGIPVAFDDQNKINQPPVTRTLGVLYKTQGTLPQQKQISNQRKWLDALLEQLPLENFVQMCMHHSFTDWLPFRWKGFRQTTRYTYIINYGGKTINDLRNNLKPDNKRIIKRALENGIRIETTNDFDLVYHYVTLSYKRQGLEFRISYNDLKLLDDAVRSRGNRVIFKAIDNANQVHAILYVVFNHKSAYGLLAGSDSKLRKMGGDTLVTWEALKYFSDKVKYYNFGGSDIERIEMHLRGFGGVLTPYFQIYNENLIWERNGIRYHLNQIVFHSGEIFKSIIKRLSGKR
jgi:hypothetical protein